MAKMFPSVSSLLLHCTKGAERTFDLEQSGHGLDD